MAFAIVLMIALMGAFLMAISNGDIKCDPWIGKIDVDSLLALINDNIGAK